MATFYVPVERKALPASDPMRWFFLEVEATCPAIAQVSASRIVLETMRLRGAVIWAAVRDCPSFEYMQQLRYAFGLSSQRGRRSIPGYY